MAARDWVADNHPAWAADETEGARKNLFQQGAQTVRNIGAGAMEGMGNLIRGVSSFRKSPQEIQAQKAREDAMVDSSMGAESNKPISGMIGEAAPFIAGGEALGAMKAPGMVGDAMASLPPWLRGATDIAKSGAINAGAGYVAGQGAGMDANETAKATGGLGMAATAIGKLFGLAIPSAASLVSKAEPNTYRFAASKGGLDALQTAAKTAPDRVQQLVNIADNPNVLPSIKGAEIAVRTPEAGAAKIDINGVLKAFDAAKIKPTDFGGDASLALRVNAALDREKSAMEGELASPPKAGKPTTSPIVDQYGGDIIRPGKPALEPLSPLVDPNKYRQMKTMIGKSVPWDSPEYKPFQSAMAQIYHKMDQDLTSAVSETQGPEVAAQYQKSLADWSQKINDFKELNSRLGGLPSARLNRADALLQQYGKQGNFDLLNRIDSHTGEGFAAHAKLRDMANQLGMKSQPTVAAADRTAELSFLPPHLRLTQVGIPAVAGEIGGPLAEIAAGVSESPALSVRALQASNKIGRGNIVYPPWLQPQAQ